MNINIPLNKKNILLDKVQQKQVLDFLGANAKSFLQNRIEEVYYINSQVRTEENYIPKEELFEALQITYMEKENAICIYIDEKDLKFKDNQGRDIWEVSPGEWISTGREKVNTLESHWRTPISGVQEEEYFFSLAMNDMVQFIQKELSHFVKRNIKGGK